MQFANCYIFVLCREEKVTTSFWLKRTNFIHDTPQDQPRRVTKTPNGAK